MAPYDLKNFLKMAAMFGQDKAMNPDPPLPQQFGGGGQFGGMNPFSGGGGMGQQPPQQDPGTIPQPPPPQITGGDVGQPGPMIAPRGASPSISDRQLPGIVGPHDPPLGDVNDIPSRPSTMGYPPFQPSISPQDLTAGPESQQSGFVPPEFSTKAFDRAYSMLDEMPTPDQPGIMRGIGSSLVSLGVGPEQGRRSMYGPYHTAMEMWKDKFEPTAQLSGQERFYNANARALYDTLARDVDRTRRTDIMEDRAQTYRMTALGKLEAQQWLRDNPKGKIDVLDDGQVIFVDDYGNITPKPYYKLTQADVAEINAQHAEELAKANQQRRITLENETLQPNRERSIAAGADAAAQSSTLESDPNRKSRYKTNADVLVQQYPHLKPFITQKGDASPEVSPVGTVKGNTRMTEDGRKWIMDKIFGTGVAQPNRQSSSARGPAPNTKMPATPPAPPGWRYVRKPDGTWTPVEDK